MESRYSNVITEIRLGDIRVDDYQRELDEARVQAILRQFDAMQVRSILVSSRKPTPEHPETGLFVVDGQHRVEALIRKFGADSLWRVELTHLTYEEEAKYFVQQADNTKAVKPQDRLAALTRRKDETAIALVDAVHRYGYCLPRDTEEEREGRIEIQAVQTLILIAESSAGVPQLESILRMYSQAWGTSPDDESARPTHQHLLGGHQFLNMAKAAGAEVDLDHMSGRLELIGSKALLRRAENHRASQNKLRNAKGNMVSHYLVYLWNDGRRRKKNRI